MYYFFFSSTFFCYCSLVLFVPSIASLTFSCFYHSRSGLCGTPMLSLCRSSSGISLLVALAVLPSVVRRICTSVWSLATVSHHRVGREQPTSALETHLDMRALRWSLRKMIYVPPFLFSCDLFCRGVSRGRARSSLCSWHVSPPEFWRLKVPRVCLNQEYSTRSTYGERGHFPCWHSPRVVESTSWVYRGNAAFSRAFTKIPRRWLWGSVDAWAVRNMFVSSDQQKICGINL